MSRFRNFLLSATFFKWLTLVLIGIIIGMFIKQNIATFNSMQPFSLDLYVAEKVQWELSIYVLLFISAGVGFLAGLGAMTKPYINVRRRLAQERAANAEREAQLRTEPHPEEPPPIVTPPLEEPPPEKPASEEPKREV